MSWRLRIQTPISVIGVPVFLPPENDLTGRIIEEYLDVCLKRPENRPWPSRP